MDGLGVPAREFRDETGLTREQPIGDDQAMRRGRTILLDPQFQIDAGLLREKQMPALDAVDGRRSDLPSGDGIAQQHFVRRVCKKDAERKIDVHLVRYLVERSRYIARCGNRRVLLAVGKDDRCRLAVVEQIVLAVIAGKLDGDPVGTAHDDLHRMEYVKRLSGLIQVYPDGSRRDRQFPGQERLAHLRNGDGGFVADRRLDRRSRFIRWAFGNAANPTKTPRAAA